MFIERKEYKLTHASETVTYDITDDYGHTVQLTPEQAETLYQWLASKSTRVHRDAHGGKPLDELAARWKEPSTVTIHLHNGKTIDTEVNGLAFDKKSGFILLNGKDIAVIYQDGGWREL